MQHDEPWWNRSVLPWLVEKACRSSTILKERKRWVPQAKGDVLELGVGSGLNLPFYDPAHVHNVVGIDVSSSLLRRAQARVAEARVPTTLQRASAEQLPFADGAFDTVLVTYSLCSVPDVARALREVRRVLRRDVSRSGKLIFVEHGLSDDPRIAKWQKRAAPLWSCIGGGCRLDRNIREMIASAGFDFDVLEQKETPATLRITAFGYQGIAS
jgi:ubiquinone/menaquinone biosynthesis C-methylase UbiE